MDERPGFSEYLRALASTQSCGGIATVLRDAHRVVAHERTIYRWHQALGDQLVTYPSITTEPLGLCHAFIITKDDTDEWHSSPYTIQTAKASAGCTSNEHFVHAIIPNEYRQVVQANLKRDGSARMWWGRSGWEHYPFADLPLLPARWETGRATSILHDEPLVLPVIFEHWGRRHSLASLWSAIAHRLGTTLTHYVGRHHYTTNGKTHVADAYRTLTNAGLFRQQIVRYQPHHRSALNIIVIARWDETTLHDFLTTAAAHASLVCTHPLDDGWLVHLIGQTPLVHTIMDAHPDHVYFLNDPTTKRWRYEELFDPITKTWVLPPHFRPTRGTA